MLLIFRFQEETDSSEEARRNGELTPDSSTVINQINNFHWVLSDEKSEIQTHSM